MKVEKYLERPEGSHNLLTQLFCHSLHLLVNHCHLFAFFMLYVQAKQAFSSFQSDLFSLQNLSI